MHYVSKLPFLKEKLLTKILQVVDMVHFGPPIHTFLLLVTFFMLDVQSYVDGLLQITRWRYHYMTECSKKSAIKKNNVISITVVLLWRLRENKNFWLEFWCADVGVLLKMLSEIKSSREHGTILTKVQNGSASDLQASEQLANQNSW